MSEATRESATLRLELESRPESVVLVRALVATVGELAGLTPRLIDDLKTAVSEAANNVVLHAYSAAPERGPLILAMNIHEAGLDVTIEDHGTGLNRLGAPNHGMGLGLVVISALADRARFDQLPGGGTEVSMSFPARGAVQRLRERAEEAGTDDLADAFMIPERLAHLDLAVWELDGDSASRRTQGSAQSSPAGR